MKSKKIAALVVLIAGVALFIFSMVEKSRVNSANSSISKGSSMFSGNKAANSIGDYLHGEANQYNTTLMICQVSGIILIIVGGGMFYFFRKKR
jgi:hypothetical protein